MSRSARLLTLALCAAAPLVAQGAVTMSRVLLPLGPTNMWVDWSQVSTAPAVQPDSFIAVMPLTAVSQWAFWEPDQSMDLTFGPGNWRQLVMTAEEWAYLSADPCAHQPAAGSAAPLSLLTSDYDSGPYVGLPGTPLFAGATYSLPFGALSHSVGGLMNMGSFSLERWQLRTRGFFAGDLWNACPPNGQVTANFSGVLVARFSFVVQ